MPEMTVKECADKLDNWTFAFIEDINARDFAVSVLRRVASGELVPVVHGYWEKVKFSRGIIACSGCGTYFQERQMAHKDHCPKCGALMDRKDDSHE